IVQFGPALVGPAMHADLVCRVAQDALDFARILAGAPALHEIGDGDALVRIHIQQRRVADVEGGILAGLARLTDVATVQVGGVAEVVHGENDTCWHGTLPGNRGAQLTEGRGYLPMQARSAVPVLAAGRGWGLLLGLRRRTTPAA